MNLDHLKKPKPKQAFIGARVPQEHKDKLEELCLKEDVSLSSLLADIIAKFLQHHGL